MCRVLVVANVKGGVGKTTTTVNIAAALHERGRRVLAVDLDPQAALTISFGVDPEQVKETIYTLINAAPDTPNQAIIGTPDNLDLIPANETLRDMEREIERDAKRIYAIGTVLQKMRDQYDYILLDCPANMGPLSGAALVAADEVIIPVTSDYLGLRVLRSLFHLIKEIQQQINPKLRVAGIFLTMYDSRTRHARNVLTALHNTYASEIPLFSAVVHQSVKIKESTEAGFSVLKHASSSKPAQAYRIIAAEIEDGIPGAPQPAAVVATPSTNTEQPLATPEYIATSTPTPNPEPLTISENFAPPIFETEPEPATVPENTDAAIPAEPELLVASALPSDYLAFCRATEMDPSNVESWLGRAETAPSWIETIRCFAYVIHLAPARADARIGIEKQLREHVSDSTSAENPELLDLAQYLCDVGCPSYAARLYRRVTELEPLKEQAWLGRARTSDNLPDKLNFVKQALEINPQNTEARDLYRIMASLVGGKPEQRRLNPLVYDWRVIALGVVLLLIVVSFFLVSVLTQH